MNKIIVSIVFAAIQILGINKITDVIFYVEKPEKSAYQIESVTTVASTVSAETSLEVGNIMAIFASTSAAEGAKVFKKCAACHSIAAEMVGRGVQPETVYTRVYGSAPLRKYQLLSRALETLEHDPDFGVTWMTIPKDAYEELGILADDLDGIVDIPRSITGTQVGLLFRLTKSGEVKISFRSNGPVDVNLLARRFQGGGHVKASGAVVAGPIAVSYTHLTLPTRDLV